MLDLKVNEMLQQHPQEVYRIKIADRERERYIDR
jgi:hypothetical protein